MYKVLLTHASDETAERPYDDGRGHRPGSVEDAARGDEDARAHHDAHDEGEAAEKADLAPQAVPVTVGGSIVHSHLMWKEGTA